jgi:hypothetical protein
MAHSSATPETKPIHITEHGKRHPGSGSVKNIASPNSEHLQFGVVIVMARKDVVSPSP